MCTLMYALRYTAGVAACAVSMLPLRGALRGPCQLLHPLQAMLVGVLPLPALSVHSHLSCWLVGDMSGASGSLNC
jgi:hypothetical protein